MNTIPYFLRNPVIDDQEQQVATMAPPAPQGMSVVQHPMHAMITPIKGEPLSSMRPAEDPGQEPSAMSSSDAEGMGGGQMSSSLASKQPKVVTMSPMERYEDSINQRLMADYKKDQNSTLAAIRARLAATENNTRQFDNAFFPFWDAKQDTTSVVRLVPDGNESNTFFWVEKQLIKLPFNGIKGGDSKPVTALSSYHFFKSGKASK